MEDKKKKSTKTTETSQQKLARLAGKRVPKAVKAIAGIANLKSYKPTAVQAKAIIAALTDAVNACANRLTATETKTESQFQLPTSN